uniref:Uncharacterized protein n=1 Tax=Anopheles darlingi TaxID=43151 RepID=A0A2M4DGD6_ANODA
MLLLSTVGSFVLAELVVIAGSLERTPALILVLAEDDDMLTVALVVVIAADVLATSTAALLMHCGLDNGSS